MRCLGGLFHGDLRRGFASWSGGGIQLVMGAHRGVGIDLFGGGSDLPSCTRCLLVMLSSSGGAGMFVWRGVVVSVWTL